MTDFLGIRCRCCEHCTAPCPGVRARAACDDAVCTCGVADVVFRSVAAQHEEIVADQASRFCKILESLAAGLEDGVDEHEVAMIARGAAMAILSPADRDKIRDELLAKVDPPAPPYVPPPPRAANEDLWVMWVCTHCEHYYDATHDSISAGKPCGSCGHGHMVKLRDLQARARAATDPS